MSASEKTYVCVQKEGCVFGSMDKEQVGEFIEDIITRTHVRLGLSGENAGRDIIEIRSMLKSYHSAKEIIHVNCMDFIRQAGRVVVRTAATVCGTIFFIWLMMKLGIDKEEIDKAAALFQSQK